MESGCVHLWVTKTLLSKLNMLEIWWVTNNSLIVAVVGLRWDFGCEKTYQQISHSLKTKISSLALIETKWLQCKNECTHDAEPCHKCNCKTIITDKKIITDNVTTYSTYY